MATIRKKLIEVSIPLESINAASAREKSIRHGHPSTLHLWWARRPLAACRAVLFAQLVDDPSSWPERFDNDETKIETERKRLHKVIADMVEWPGSKPAEQAAFERAIEAARWEIARSFAWGLGEEPPAKDDTKAILDFLQTKAPPVYDPFSGGGSIPLEAQRLGLRAYGSDLNPVAVLIGKALVEIPPKFVGRPPVNPKAREEAKNGALRAWKGAQGLAEDVRYYGKWMRDEAEKRIGHLYPKAKLQDGKEATVIAWLWARTVRSPDPAAKGAMVPLVSSFMLSTKEGKKAWVEPVIDAAAPDGWRFEVEMGTLANADEERRNKGTKGEGRGSNFSCVLSGATIQGDYIKSVGMAGRMGSRLMAVVAAGTRSRIYLSPSDAQEAVAKSLDDNEIVLDAKTGGLNQPVPAKLTGGTCYNYGLTSFDKLFTPRQLVALTTFSDLVGEARKKALADARTAGVSNDNASLHSGGSGATAYADAITTYLAFCVDKMTDTNSSLCSWQVDPPRLRATFSRQALPMVWDYAEANIFADAAGDFGRCVQSLREVLDRLVPTASACITQADAAEHQLKADLLFSTDPPYYDNIGYADLSDYFYVWLKHSLSGVWPELFRRLTTPKVEELVATPYRHGGKELAETFFMDGVSSALAAVCEAAAVGEPLAIYYAFKQSEVIEGGITSAGWASFLQAVVDASLSIDGTWPIRSELATRSIGRDTNALASSIILVCRTRDANASTIERAEFVRALKHEMPDAIDDIRKAGVGPVDMQQSVIGPGMGVFTRYAKVLEDDDSAMSVKTALSLINRVWEEIENELDTNFDSETQVALAWFATYGLDARTSGELITLANAKNIPSNALFHSGVFKDMKGKAALIPREELPADWTPASDRTATVWECVQHTARVLNAADGGGEAAGRLVAQMGPKAEAARALAYRLFEIATKKGWAVEALVYNELAREWPKLEELASSRDAAQDLKTAQAVLL